MRIALLAVLEGCFKICRMMLELSADGGIGNPLQLELRRKRKSDSVRLPALEHHLEDEQHVDERPARDLRVEPEIHVIILFY